MTKYKRKMGKRSRVSGPFAEMQTGAWLGEGVGVDVKNVQNRVPPNTTITQQFTITNNNAYISPTDPNRCEAGLHVALSGGLEVKATAFVNGTSVATQGICIGAAGAGVAERRKELNLQFQTPQEPGTYDLRVNFVLGGDGEKFAEYLDTINVRSGSGVEQGNDPKNTDDPAFGGNFSQWAMNNPLLAAGGGLAGLVAVRTAVDSTLGGE